LIHIELASSIDLEENSNFHIADNIFVDVDTEELNVVLSFSRQAQVNKDDDTNEINVENYDGADDESIEEEKDKSSRPQDRRANKGVHVYHSSVI